MHSNPRRSCQTSRWWWLLLAAWLWTGAGLWAADPPAVPGPTPPPWQSELDADRAAKASLTLAPAKGAAENQTRRARVTASFRQLAAKYPDAFPVQKAAGDGVAQLEGLRAAVPYWLQAEKLDPHDAETASSLGSAYLEAGNAQEAAGQYGRAVADKPDVASYHSDLANVLYLFRHDLLAPPALPDEQAVLRLALEHFRRAAALAPGDLKLAQAYAETFYIFPKPDWSEALAAWQHVRALSGGNQDFANLQLARVSLRLGRGADARGYLDSIHGPSFADLKTKLGRQAARLETASPSPAPQTGAK